jgi:hypothetical protein
MANDRRLSGAQPHPRSESDVRFNYNNLDQIIGASNDHVRPTQAQFYSIDGGATWNQSGLPSVKGDSFQSDPCVDWTSDGTAWALALGVDGVNVSVGLHAFKSLDGGATWTLDDTIGTRAADKPSLWVDHSPSSPHRDNIYALWTYTDSGATYVARRDGPGGTWQAPVPVSGPETTGGSIGGDVKTNTFGDVFAFWPSEGPPATLYVAKSIDGGASFGALGAPVPIAHTFGSYQIWPPAQSVRGCLIYISGAAYRTATEDLVYACWADMSGDPSCPKPSDQTVLHQGSACTARIYFARSLDGGDHWSPVPTKINDQPPRDPTHFFPNDQFFPRLALDETSGDLMVIYYDTFNDPARLKTDIWMQCSNDGGAGWTSPVRVTSSESDETKTTDRDQYGDYIGLSGHAGHFFGCWTDSRSGLEEIWGTPIPFISRAITFELDRDHYGQDEIDAARSPSGSVVPTAFWVVVDGFTARELGITGPGSTAVGPPVLFSPSTGVHATCTTLDSTDSAFPPDGLQRFRFGYDVDFGLDDSAFTSFPGDQETLTLTTSFKGMPAAAQVVFMKQPDPYILQGAQRWWLSRDIRLIQVAEGDTRFGVTMHTDPQQFLIDVTSALESGQGVAGGETFDGDTSEDSEVISVAPQTRRGTRLVNVYNFAIARVHYQADKQDAPHVRVFFRLFAANSTDTTFHPDTTYRRNPPTYPVLPSQFGQHTTPTPGVIGGEYVTIPCFAAPRSDPTQPGAPNTLPTKQPDTLNDRRLMATGGPRHDSFFGCFLDINQSTPGLPGMPPAGNADGPWSPSVLEPIQQAFIRNEHQCLVAEIAFDQVPISPGTQPFNSDKLAQRNIAWSRVANPGTLASRQALETFEVRPTPTTALAATFPDEIMIDWTNVPAGEPAEIYLPAVSADAVLENASRLYPTNRLSRVDANTIGCVTGGITYIPLPPGEGAAANFAGLMSISLPSGIRRGELYHIVVRQLTNAMVEPRSRTVLTAAEAAQQRVRWRRVLGTFQINVPVSTAAELLATEELRLSIFRWIAHAIPTESRWYPVFQRYVSLLADRVSALGGDPAQIVPSMNGYDGLPEPLGRTQRPRRDHETAGITGKVKALLFDHFGDFDGFILELKDGHTRHFESREGEIEALVREAWEDRILMTVLESPQDPCLPVAVMFLHSTALSDHRHRH